MTKTKNGLLVTAITLYSLALIGIIGLVICIVAVAAPAHINDQIASVSALEPRVDPGTSLDELASLVPVSGTNQSGQSYGVADGHLVSGQHPDLVAVVATNGRSGYAYSAALLDDPGSPEKVMNPEGALAYMWQRNLAEAQAFNAYITATTGSDPVAGVTENAEVFKLLAAASKSELQFASLDSELQDMLRQAATINTGAVDDAIVAKALKAGYMSTDRCVPVYKADGVTIIGELRVG
jgi:hypothetical protein